MSTTSPSQNPFELSRDTLIAKLWELRIPKAYPAFPSPGHHEGVAHYLRELVAILDTHLADIGAEVRDNANCAIDSNLFAGSFAAVIDGNETYAIECAAEAVRDSRRVA